ncbi:MAG: UvrB/UvrC motif-containing protein [Lachnospiraceae bacterium]|nr:UvrB/UvrC motif-containing protein [Lachnospiraceae bacterium]
MLCEICHTREANITYTEIINGQKREQHLCQVCAGEQTLAITGKLGNEISIGSILSGILQNYAKGLAAKSANEPVCQRCGMTASNLIKDGRLGCPECYNAFSMILEKNLKTVQGSVEHHGKVPANAARIEINPAQSAGRTAAEVMNAATEEIVRQNEAGRKKKNTKAKSLSEKTEKPAHTSKDAAARIEDYRKQLNAALAEENYEEAARLRDLIRAVEAAEQTEFEVPKPKTKRKTASAKETAPKAKKPAAKRGTSAKGGALK